MKKYLLSILVAFCMVLCLTPMAAFADDVPMTINIDVGGEHGRKSRLQNRR